MAVGGQGHALTALPSRKRFGTHCTGGCVCLRNGVDGCEKPRPPGFDLQTVQPVTSSYTNYTIPRHIWENNIKKNCLARNRIGKRGLE
jgi:hypothetical protein